MNLSGIDQSKHSITRHMILLTNQNTFRILIGNKADLVERREVSEVEARQFARKHNILYLETSALINQEVEYAFEV